MTNKIGKALFSKAGELGVPVGFMCMKVVQLLAFNSLIWNYIRTQVIMLYKLFTLGAITSFLIRENGLTQ